MAANIGDDGVCGRLRLRDAGNMWRQKDLGMVPERMFGRQRLRFSDVEDSAADMAAVERFDKSHRVELLTAAGMD